MSEPTPPHTDSYSDGPVWHAFNLTRASYAVFPRRALCSMPLEWQERFMDLINEALWRLPDGTFDGHYSVQLRDARRRFVTDPNADYRHAGPLPLRNQENPTP